MLRVGFVALGLVLQVLAGTIYAVGAHDGVLGATPREEFPGPGEGPQVVTMRINVAGGPLEARPILESIHDRSIISSTLQAENAWERFVLGRLAGDDSLVLLEQAAASPGSTVVVRGTVETHQVALPERGNVQVGLVLVLETLEVREPVFFKTD